MMIKERGIYHIYNRGNNKRRIFFRENNYDYFFQKCHKYLKPVSEILAWCFMPNHFHFLVEVTSKSLEPIRSGGIIMPALSNGFRLLQSSYAKGINRQEGTTGNLFQQKTKAKLVSGSEDYSLTAFLYIHNNPLEAGLSTSPGDWEYSSFKEYTEPKDGGLCNRQKGIELLRLSELDLESDVFGCFDEPTIKKLYH